MGSPRFALLVPVKAGVDAKSRLGYDAPRRAALRRAFVQDTVAAAQACPGLEVHVVGDGSMAPGVHVVPDEGDGDLNRAIVRAAARIATPGLGVAVLLGDLPCLLADDLAAALADRTDRFYVADAEGTGTTLLAAAAGVPLTPAFGAGSAARHTASGALALPGSLASLRRDVDTAADLDAAVALGVGAHTRAALGLD